MPRVPRDPGLPGSGAPSAPHGQHDTRVEHPVPGATQARSAIGMPAWIGDQVERNVGFGPERRQLVRLAVADHDHTGPACTNLFVDGAQLCDLLAAEDSPEVADEDQHGGAPTHPIPEVDLATVRP